MVLGHRPVTQGLGQVCQYLTPFRRLALAPFPGATGPAEPRTPARLGRHADDVYRAVAAQWRSAAAAGGARWGGGTKKQDRSTRSIYRSVLRSVLKATPKARSKVASGHMMCSLGISPDEFGR